MRLTYLFIGLTAAACLAVLTACEKDSLQSPPEADLVLATDKAGPSNTCFNVKIGTSPGDLGCATIASPLDCTGSQPTLSNFGAISTAPVQFGPYSGDMTSIATGLAQSGNGAQHITLIHYFKTVDGNHSFWTEDQAVCAPGNDPFACQVNDVLNIVGGCGDFAGATGKLHTHGELRYGTETELCPLFYLNGGEAMVPTGTLAVRWHGRICLAN